MESGRHLKLLVYRVLVYSIVQVLKHTVTAHQENNIGIYIHQCIICSMIWTLVCGLNIGQFCVSRFRDQFLNWLFQLLAFLLGNNQQNFLYETRDLIWKPKQRLFFNHSVLVIGFCFIRYFMVFYDIFTILELYSRIRSEISRGFDLHRTPMR